MHIFLVNDDGIGSKGIMALYRAAVERGHEVTMCAPRHQQSAACHRFTLSDPLFVTEFPLDAEGCEGYAITGSPADCVRVGLKHIKDTRKPVDVVISGINDGYNAGIAVHYSGTVGAAVEGSFHYIPSIAVSIAYKAEPDMFDNLARYTIEMAEKYVKTHPPRCSILNINAPRLQPLQQCGGGVGAGAVVKGEGHIFEVVFFGREGCLCRRLADGSGTGGEHKSCGEQEKQACFFHGDSMGRK